MYVVIALRTNREQRFYFGEEVCEDILNGCYIDPAPHTSIGVSEARERDTNGIFSGRGKYKNTQ